MPRPVPPTKNDCAWHMWAHRSDHCSPVDVVIRQPLGTDKDRYTYAVQATRLRQVPCGEAPIPHKVPVSMVWPSENGSPDPDKYIFWGAYVGLPFAGGTPQLTGQPECAGELRSGTLDHLLMALH